MRWRPRLRTVLLTVNLLILSLPVAGVFALRLYENELIRRTEEQLVVQGAVVREAYRQRFVEGARAAGLLSVEPGVAPDFGRPVEVEPLSAEDGDLGLSPIPPRLDISEDPVHPPAPGAAPAPAPPDPLAEAAGWRISPVLQSAARTTLAGIRVVDANGVVVASSRGELHRSLSEREEVARALRGETVRLLRERISDEPAPPLRSLSRGQRYRVFVALPVIEHDRVVGAVILSRTPLDVAKALYLNRRPLMVGAAAVVAVVVLVSVLTSFTISRPVRGLIRQAEQVSRGTRTAVEPPASPGIWELARLSVALGEMARNLEDRASYIRTFASHVSHEFKTPLTTIRGTVELLGDHLEEMSAQQRARFLANLDEASGHLERLVSRLLEKARADMHRPGDETADVAEVLFDVADRFRREGMHVTVYHGQGVDDVRMAPDTLADVLGHLLDNAREHGGEGVRVTVTTRFDRSGAPPAVDLTVADDGPGISEANADRIFTPFFTTARERGGSGLGLGIVRSLLEAHGGCITLERTDRGASFRARLPAGTPATRED